METLLQAVSDLAEIKNDVMHQLFLLWASKQQTHEAVFPEIYSIQDIPRE